jgi:hypothetical protein
MSVSFPMPGAADPVIGAPAGSNRDICGQENVANEEGVPANAAGNEAGLRRRAQSAGTFAQRMQADA